MTSPLSSSLHHYSKTRPFPSSLFFPPPHFPFEKRKINHQLRAPPRRDPPLCTRNPAATSPWNNEVLWFVPVELGNLSSLVELNLSMNALSGLLHVEFMHVELNVKKASNHARMQSLSANCPFVGSPEDPVRLNAHEAFGFQDLLATQGVPRDATNMFREFNVHQDYAGGVGDEVDEDGSDERGFDESREGSNMRCSQDPGCLHSIHGSSCSRSSVSIKRKSFDTAIDPVSGKKELSLYGTSEFNNASCGREIGIILRSNFKGPWYSWDKVDAMCKDELFKEFKLAIQCDILSSGFQKPVNTLNWPPFSSILVTLGGPGGPGKRNKYAFPEEDEVIVRKIWEDKARTCLNLQLTRARKKAMSIIGTTNIIDCLDKGPVWIQNEDWNTMINDVWSTDRFCKRSKTSKQNRLKQTDGKISTHSAGSVSFASYRATRTGRGKELPWDEVFSALHQKSNETGTFVDNRSKIVVEKYRNEMVARYGPDQDNHPSFDGAAWCEASGGVSKGRVYGAPRMPKSKVDVSSSSHTYSVNSSYPSTSTTRRTYGSRYANTYGSVDAITCGSVDASPVAPSMPSPTMAPGHRPRPQMPYNGPSSSHQQHRRSFPP
uniref:Uncharacterized protein n=1 Tax=Salix viminalis TaxID=40686 RepID=A0A6N2L991_SALVM